MQKRLQRDVPKVNSLIMETRNVKLRKVKKEIQGQKNHYRIGSYRDPYTHVVSDQENRYEVKGTSNQILEEESSFYGRRPEESNSNMY